MRKAQKENGALPGIVPTSGWGFEWGNGPAWVVALIEIAYQLYRFGGDTGVLKENAAAIEKYEDYLYTRVNKNGLIGFGLGDWLEAGAPSPDSYSTPVEITDTLTCIELLRKAEEIQQILGNAAAAEKSRNLERRLTENFKKLHLENSVVDCETQTAQAMAMSLNLFEDTEAAYSELKRIIQKDGRFKAGILGAKRLFDCLCDYGDGETALRLLTDDTHPEYAHNLRAGATTLWEDFQIYDLSALPDSLVRKDGGGIISLNHHCWGSISAWLFNRVAGLCIESPKRVEIAPCFIKGLPYAEAEYFREKRCIRVRWERKEQKITLTVEKRFLRKSIRGRRTRVRRRLARLRDRIMQIKTFIEITSIN